MLGVGCSPKKGNISSDDWGMVYTDEPNTSVAFLRNTTSRVWITPLSSTKALVYERGNSLLNKLKRPFGVKLFTITKLDTFEKKFFIEAKPTLDIKIDDRLLKPRKGITIFYDREIKKVVAGNYNLKLVIFYKTNLSIKNDNEWRNFKSLGRNCFRSIYKVFSIRQKKYCVLKIQAEYITDKTRKEVEEVLKNEIKLMLNIRHPNIITLLSFNAETKPSWLLFELALGGNLCTRVMRSESGFSENYARYIFKQVLNALEYLSSHDIVHRGIKPKNILFMSSKKWSFVKISNFENSFFINGNSKILPVFGDLVHLSPEARKTDLRKLSEKVLKRIDSWSVGICLYFALTLVHPFHTLENFGTTTNGETKRNICLSLKKNLSNDVNHFINKCLAFNPNLRYSIEQLNKHDWIKKPL